MAETSDAAAPAAADPAAAAAPRGGEAGPSSPVMMTGAQKEMLHGQITRYAEICRWLGYAMQAAHQQQPPQGLPPGSQLRPELGAVTPAAAAASMVAAAVPMGGPPMDPAAAAATWDPMAAGSSAPKQRWAPTAHQLVVMEQVYNDGNGTPSRAALQGMVTDLLQHGPITASNLYNWFQNRKARAKRKALARDKNDPGGAPAPPSAPRPVPGSARDKEARASGSGSPGSTPERTPPPGEGILAPPVDGVA